jgi:hypothetical protein
MRGPLLSGALGSPATLGRLCNLVQEHSPVVVLSALWLAETLSAEIPILALVEEEKRSAARRAHCRTQRLGQPLSIVVAASDVPLAANSVGAILVDSLVDIEDETAACELLVALLHSLKPDGIVISLDATKNPDLEARVAGIFLGANLANLKQIRPREGALLTIGNAPHPAISLARFCSLGLDIE